MADDYKIKIVTEGDPRGAERVAGSIDKVSRAAKDNTKATQESARGMNELGEASAKGASLGRVLGEITRGNIGAISNLGTALKATSAAMKSSVFGVALVGATALWNFLPGLIDRLRSARGEVDETAKTGDHLAEAFTKIAKARGSALTAHLAELEKQAKGTSEQLERVLSIQERIAKAKDEDTPEAQRNRADTRLGSDFQSAMGARDSTAAIASDLAARMFELSQNARVGPNRLKEDREAMERELRALGPIRPDSSFAGVERNLRIMDISRRMSGGEYAPETEKFIAEQSKLITELAPLLEKANEAATKADEAFQRIAQRVGGLRPDGRGIPESGESIARGLEDRRRREAAGFPEPVSQTGSSTSIVGGGYFSARGAGGESIGERIAAIVAERQRAGEEAMISALRRRLAEDERFMQDRLKALQR